MSALSPSQLHILRHSLGYDDKGYLREDSAGTNRNYYVSGGTPDLESLVVAGLMRNDGQVAFSHDDNCYRVTDAGREVLLAHAPKRPKYTRAQQRYRDFLDWKEAWQGTFREYLAHLTAERRAGR